MADLRPSQFDPEQPFEHPPAIFFVLRWPLGYAAANGDCSFVSRECTAAYRTDIFKSKKVADSYNCLGTTCVDNCKAGEVDDKKMNSEEMDLEIKRIKMERERRLLQKEIDRDELKTALIFKIRPMFKLVASKARLMLKLTATIVVLAIVGALVEDFYRGYERSQRNKQNELEEQASQNAFGRCKVEFTGMWECADNGVQRELIRKSGAPNVPACYTAAEYSLCIDREHENFMKSNS